MLRTRQIMAFGALTLCVAAAAGPAGAFTPRERALRGERSQPTRERCQHHELRTDARTGVVTRWTLTYGARCLEA